MLVYSTNCCDWDSSDKSQRSACTLDVPIDKIVSSFPVQRHVDHVPRVSCTVQFASMHAAKVWARVLLPQMQFTSPSEQPVSGRLATRHWSCVLLSMSFGKLLNDGMIERTYPTTWNIENC
jgi:hypothetical protein